MKILTLETVTELLKLTKELETKISLAILKTEDDSWNQKDLIRARNKLIEVQDRLAVVHRSL